MFSAQANWRWPTTKPGIGRGQTPAIQGPQPAKDAEAAVHEAALGCHLVSRLGPHLDTRRSGLLERIECHRRELGSGNPYRSRRFTASRSAPICPAFSRRHRSPRAATLGLVDPGPSGTLGPGIGLELTRRRHARTVTPARRFARPGLRGAQPAVTNPASTTAMRPDAPHRRTTSPRPVRCPKHPRRAPTSPESLVRYLAASGCARTAAPPPPEVSIETFSPRAARRPGVAWNCAQGPWTGGRDGGRTADNGGGGRGRGPGSRWVRLGGSRGRGVWVEQSAVGGARCADTGPAGGAIDRPGHPRPDDGDHPPRGQLSRHRKRAPDDAVPHQRAPHRGEPPWGRSSPPAGCRVRTGRPIANRMTRPPPVGPTGLSRTAARAAGPRRRSTRAAVRP